MLLCGTTILCSCNKEYIPQEVELSVGYTFMESGSMSRASGSDVYNEFYENYIKTRVLTPTTYELTFTNTETGATATMNGLWKNKDAIRLTEGTYDVKGSSVPIYSKLKGEPSDTTYLSFNEKITITKDMSSILLQAKYDSYLLMFDNQNIDKIYYQHYYDSSYANTHIEHNLYKTESIFSLFIRDFNYGDTNKPHRIYLTRKDGQKISITLDKFQFEKGKYYYFNDMDNSFDLPPMQSGN